jgi:hypothetical protein
VSVHRYHVAAACEQQHAIGGLGADAFDA